MTSRKSYFNLNLFKESVKTAEIYCTDSYYISVFMHNAPGNYYEKQCLCIDVKRQQ